VAARLDGIALEQRRDEIRLRVGLLAGQVKARVKPESRQDLGEAVARAKGEIEEQLALLDPEGPIAAEWEAAETEVRTILEAGDQLEMFRGKPIFDEFYDRHAKRSSLSKRAFAYAVATAATRQVRLEALIAEPVRRISEYVPDDLVGAADEVSIPEDNPELRTKVEMLRAAREAWEGGGALPVSGEELRGATVALARHAEAAGQAEVAARLRKGAASLAPQVATAVAA
jgi:hypothetical protein